MPVCPRWFAISMVGVLALTAAVVTSTDTASAVTSYVDGPTQPANRNCAFIGGTVPTPVATTTVGVWRNNVSHQPVASATGGTVNTFYVRIRVVGVFNFTCATEPVIPLLTLPAGVHIDPSPTFAILCSLNGVVLQSGTAKCPGKTNLVAPSVGAPLEYHRSAADHFWPFSSTPTTADVYEFQFPVYADRIFANRPVGAGVGLSNGAAVSSVVQAAVFRPFLTCDGHTATVATQFGEASTNGNDVIVGSPGNDRISGGFGNDIICGGTGNDTIDGGPGNDIVNGGAGNDDMSGGTGIDTVDYTGRPPVRVNLGLFGFQNTVGAGSDNIGDFENILGTAGADTLIGNGANNTISGGGGNDHLAGGAGKDTLSGGAGTDTCDGGPGTDVAISCEKRTGFP
jgi:Ca2+-binding RTX toxin-like protein